VKALLKVQLSLRKSVKKGDKSVGSDKLDKNPLKYLQGFE